MKLLRLSKEVWALSISIFGAAITVVAFQNCAPQVQFSDVVTEASIVQTFKPALAINQTQCIFCHAAVSGNMIVGVGKTTINLHGVNGGGAGDFMYGNWQDYQANALSSSTMFHGSILLPRAPLNAESEKAAELVRQQGQSTLGTLMNNPSAEFNFIPYQPSSFPITTLARQFNFSLNTRTNEYRNFLKTKNAAKNFLADKSVEIKEVESVVIRAPAAAEFRALIGDAGVMKYVKESSSSRELRNFGSKGTYFGNDPAQIMTCDGDIFVDGVVFLKDLRLESQNGCRIYATGSVFLEGPISEVENRPGITYYGDHANLQISSSRMIGLGIGQCTTTPDEHYPSPELGSMGRRLGAGGPYEDDYFKVRNSAGVLQLRDAGDCGGGPRRSVQFDRLLLNAQQVHSRYTAHFNGVIIADFLLWSLGHFVYSYDQVFDKVPILPKLAPSQYLSMTECAADKVQDNGALKECITE